MCRVVIMGEKNVCCVSDNGRQYVCRVVIMGDNMFAV